MNSLWIARYVDKVRLPVNSLWIALRSRELTTFKLRRLTWKQSAGLALAGVITGALFASGGFAFAATQEQHDSFCASCHTHPESTYYERSIASPQVDLATAHTLKDTKCIDCHSGPGLSGRVSAELMGAQNAVMWYSGRAVQPAPLTHAIGDDHCVKCHAQVRCEDYDMDIRSELFGPKGHYHAYLTRWKAADPNAANCVGCHSGHGLGGSADTTWIVSADVQNVCQACHAVLGTN